MRVPNISDPVWYPIYRDGSWHVEQSTITNAVTTGSDMFPELISFLLLSGFSKGISNLCLTEDECTRRVEDLNRREQATMPVFCCEDCGAQFTDHRGEEARDAAVNEYKNGKNTKED